MTDLRQQTIKTYNNSAIELAEYFRGIGAREKYIDIAFNLAAQVKNTRVVEIGCGDGRDAKVIAKRAGWYLGFDISEKLIELAKNRVPGVEFMTADAVTFNYPDKLNIVFAFASLLHLNKKEIKTVLTKVDRALKPGGIFYISLKWAPSFEKQIKEDRFGRRLFYFYNAEIIEDLATPKFKVEKTWREFIGHTDWFEIALKKI